MYRYNYFSILKFVFPGISYVYTEENLVQNTTISANTIVFGKSSSTDKKQIKRSHSLSSRPISTTSSLILGFSDPAKLVPCSPLIHGI